VQSDANQSPSVKFPDQQGKYREFHDLETVKADGMVEKPRFHQAFSKNSLDHRTGNLKSGTGDF